MLSGLSKPLRYAVFISGTGSTLQSLLEMQHQWNIGLVISNQSQALGLTKAKRFGIETVVIKNPIDYAKLNDLLQDYRIDRIVLAGFMKLIPASFVNFWKGRMMNIHPSLLPQYPGLDAAHLSWQNKSDMGVTIHHVTAEMDEGRPVLQQVSLKKPYAIESGFEFPELYLRQCEQNLMRELAIRWT